MRILVALLILIILGVVGFTVGSDYVRRHPQDFPWTDLSLGDPIGQFTGTKLSALGGDPRRCRALLAAAYSGDRVASAVRVNADCGFEDGMRLGKSASTDVGFEPSGLVTSCPVAASLLLWERRIVQPAAEQHFGSRVAEVEHAGSYSCRRLYGRSDGPFSAHATADAVDIIAFRLADGRRVTVLGDWSGDVAERTFLREVRAGACGLFATVLSPDYNDAHRDHLHFDHARRGLSGWTMCR